MSPRLPLPMLAGLALVAVGGLYIWKKGGIAGAASAIGAGTVEAVGGAVSGAAGAIGAGVGLPTPAETATEPEVARWIIDNVGQFEASKWTSAGAYLRAQFMEAGTGRPPAVDSPAGRALLGKATPQADYDETDRLVRRHPAPYAPGPESIFSGQSQGGSFGSLSGLDGGSFDYQTTPWRP